MKTKFLITGSNGLLGQKLVKLLLDKSECEVVATSRGKNRLPFPETNYQYFSMDITQPQEVDAVMAQVQPDVVIHTAAMTHVDQRETDHEGCLALNVEAVKHIIVACKQTNAFLIHLSTDFIFDGENGPYDEEAPANPVNFYGETKLKAEALISNSDISWALVRTVLVYGIAHDMSRSNIILWVKKSLEEGKEIRVVDDQLRSPTLAEDLAMGCYLIGMKRAKGIFNICGKELLSPYEMAEKTAVYFGLDTSTMQRANASNFKELARRPLRTGLLIDKARQELGYKPHSFDEGIGIVAAQIQAKAD